MPEATLKPMVSLPLPTALAYISMVYIIVYIFYNLTHLLANKQNNIEIKLLAT